MAENSSITNTRGYPPTYTTMQEDTHLPAAPSDNRGLNFQFVDSQTIGHVGKLATGAMQAHTKKALAAEKALRAKLESERAEIRERLTDSLGSHADGLIRGRTKATADALSALISHPVGWTASASSEIDYDDGKKKRATSKGVISDDDDGGAPQDTGRRGSYTVSISFSRKGRDKARETGQPLFNTTLTLDCTGEQLDTLESMIAKDKEIEESRNRTIQLTNFSQTGIAQAAEAFAMATSAKALSETQGGVELMEQIGRIDLSQLGIDVPEAVSSAMKSGGEKHSFIGIEGGLGYSQDSNAVEPQADGGGDA